MTTTPTDPHLPSLNATRLFMFRNKLLSKPAPETSISDQASRIPSRIMGNQHRRIVPQSTKSSPDKKSSRAGLTTSKS